MTKMAGCWEHMPLVSKGLKAAKINKLNLAAVSLDIANPYGSVPHHLIVFALEHYRIDSKWVDLLKSYYGGLWSQLFSPTEPSNWHKHLRGIFTGCTVSIILILAGTNVILEFIVAGTEAENIKFYKKVVTLA